MGAHGLVPPLKGVDLPQSHASADPNPPSRTANRAATSIDARLQHAAPIGPAPPPPCGIASTPPCSPAATGGTDWAGAAPALWHCLNPLESGHSVLTLAPSAWPL